MQNEKPRRDPEVQLNIPLQRRIDRNKNEYFIAKPDLKVTIDIDDCAFFVFPHSSNPQISIQKRRGPTDREYQSQSRPPATPPTEESDGEDEDDEYEDEE